jgi:apolipoprotein N-acyltransferase
LTGSIVPLAVLTPYARLGDAFAWLCLGASALATVAVVVFARNNVS